MRRVHPTANAAVVLAGLLCACGSGSFPLASLSTSPPPSATPTPVPTTSSTPATTAATTAAPGPTAAPATPQPGPANTSPAAAASTVARPATPPELAQAGRAGQAIVVTTPGYGSNTATFTAYRRDGAGWQAVMGPWAAYVGRNGFAPPGQKAEGDGRTPSGSYGFGFFFGVAPDPGVQFPYRQVPDDTIVWDEDPASPTYNLWVDLDDTGGGHDSEGMYQPVAYRYGAVIAYNTARTPGLGSGIFLHASTGRATAGCVSLPVDRLVEVLRWLDPAQDPRIVMGVATQEAGVIRVRRIRAEGADLP